MTKITPFLWFDTQAEEAANFYVSVFKNSRIVTTTRSTEAGPGPVGSVVVVAFELDVQLFHALNGGPMFKFNESVSFMVPCETQKEVDEFWTKLSAGGEESQCGWLKDKYGLSWQITPRILLERIHDPNPAKAASVMRAMMQMRKIDIAALERAYAQG